MTKKLIVLAGMCFAMFFVSGEVNNAEAARFGARGRVNFRGGGIRFRAGNFRGGYRGGWNRGWRGTVRPYRYYNRAWNRPYYYGYYSRPGIYYYGY